MKGYVYRCPATGEELQAYLFAGGASKDGYAIEVCRACGRVHVIDPKTGEVQSSRREEEIGSVWRAA